jgi:DNA-binding HxlR family transcriptional regulator
MPARSYKERAEIERRILGYLEELEGTPKTWKELRAKARNDKISPTTLSRYLKHFEQTRLVKREVDPNHRPPRTLYRIGTRISGWTRPLSRISAKESQIVSERLSKYPERIDHLEPSDTPMAPYPLDWLLAVGLYAIEILFDSVRNRATIDGIKEELRSRFTQFADHWLVEGMTQLLYEGFGVGPPGTEVYEKAFVALIHHLIIDIFKIPLDPIGWSIPEPLSERASPIINAMMIYAPGLLLYRPPTYDPHSKKSVRDCLEKCQEYRNLAIHETQKLVGEINKIAEKPAEPTPHDSSQ